MTKRTMVYIEEVLQNQKVCGRGEYKIFIFFFFTPKLSTWRESQEKAFLLSTHNYMVVMEYCGTELPATEC